MSDQSTIQILDITSSINIVEDGQKTDIIEIGSSDFASTITIQQSNDSQSIEVISSDADSNLSVIENISESNVIEVVNNQEIEIVDGSNYIVAGNSGVSQQQVTEIVNNALYDREIIKLDASRPIAYIGYVTRIVKLDYVQFPPLISYAITSNLLRDWENRQNLVYTSN